MCSLSGFQRAEDQYVEVRILSAFLSTTAHLQWSPKTFRFGYHALKSLANKMTIFPTPVEIAIVTPRPPPPRRQRGGQALIIPPVGSLDCISTGAISRAPARSVDCSPRAQNE
jgi:hypothetical protein